LTVKVNGTSGTGQGFNSTSTYTRVYESSSTIKAQISYQSGSQIEAFTVWVLRSNGSTLALDVSGTNITGTEARGFSGSIFFGFLLESQYSQSLAFYISNGNIHSTGSSSVTLGPTKMTVTSYSASSYPFSVTDCYGTTSFTNFSLQVGTPPGTSYQFITLFHVAGTYTPTGQASEQEDFLLAVTSITVG